jgi:hypothetical protein
VSVTIPIDPKQCQAEKGGAFMFGPGRMRCTYEATAIVFESEPGEDGQVGSMALCEGCLLAFAKTTAGRGPAHSYQVWRRTSYVVNGKVRGLTRACRVIT